MYQIDFSRPIHVHFIGIGGISMSGLASVLLKEGFTVTGSDAKESSLTSLLAGQGASVFYGQSADNIPADCGLVVYTAAVHEDNPELMEARRRNLPVLTRAQLLGEIMQNYAMPAAVAGTHGKTTTTSMLSHIALSAGLDPTISVGGILQSIGGNIRVGSSPCFITEACEYTDSYLSLYPKVSIILNIDADHLDYFKTFENVRASFRKFAQLVPEDGLLVLNAGIPDLKEFTDGLKCRIATFGLQEGDYRAEQIKYDDHGCASFDLISPDHEPVRITLKVPGEHNVLNALAAVAAADFMGADRESAVSGLAEFSGTDRRFERKGERAGVTIIDDYAHHPTEIRATLNAAKKITAGKIWCVFQPHTYTRTQAHLQEFADALSLADHVVLADIYAAREQNTLGISSADIEQKLKARGADVVYKKSFEEIEELLLSSCREGDLLITMGAGDIYQVGEDLLKR